MRKHTVFRQPGFRAHSSYRHPRARAARRQPLYITSIKEYLRPSRHVAILSYRVIGGATGFSATAMLRVPSGETKSHQSPERENQPSRLFLASSARHETAAQHSVAHSGNPNETVRG